jgi:hypothetical protein
MRRLMLAFVLVFAACGGATPTSPPTPTAATACDAAFAAAAGVDEMSDSVSDLYSAIRACSTVADWSAAFAAHGGAGFTGTPTEVLRNACMAAEVASAPLCKSVEAEAPATAAPAASVPLPVPVKVTKITKTVSPGDPASITVRTIKGASCSISVEYESGTSTAAGLDPKKVDANGDATWRWVVGPKTNPQTVPVTVTCAVNGRTGEVSADVTVR